MLPFLQFGSVAVPTYGLFYLAAFLGAIALMSRLATHVGVPFWKMVDLAFQFCIAGEIGSRLFFLLVEREAFLAGQISLRQFLLAGRVVLGGIVVGSAYGIWIFRKHRLPVLPVMDACLAGVPLGMGLGRLGCLMSGCCFGSPTDWWWGITFTDPACHRISGTPLDVALHPTQILQSLDGFAICGFLVWLFFRRRFDGQVASLFFVLSGCSRVGWEFLRGDPRGAWLGLATSQWIGLVMVAVGAALYVRSARRGALGRHEEPRAGKKRR
jgi:phosphatidylglycerol:prolipoprotein diacylglycerol transferase